MTQETPILVNCDLPVRKRFHDLLGQLREPYEPYEPCVSSELTGPATSPQTIFGFHGASKSRGTMLCNRSYLEGKLVEFRHHVHLFLGISRYDRVFNGIIQEDPMILGLGRIVMDIHGINMGWTWKYSPSGYFKGWEMPSHGGLLRSEKVILPLMVFVSARLDGTGGFKGELHTGAYFMGISFR